MSQRYDIETSNFLNLLRSGAFNESKPIGIMSDFKWSRLVRLAYWHRVTPIFAKGIENFHYDDNLNIPDSQIEQIKEQLREFPSQGISDLYVFDRIHLKNKKLEERLQQLINKEYGDMEKSYETMQVMAILLTNVENILSYKSLLKGVIDLGRYLRLDGDKVDFVKLEKWLAQTKMTDMANMQGNLLIEGFGFSKEELPFVTKIDPRSYRWLKRALMQKEFRHHPSINTSVNQFALSSPMTAFRAIRHTLAYRSLAPGEVISTISKGIMRGLAEIDE